MKAKQNLTYRNRITRKEFAVRRVTSYRYIITIDGEDVPINQKELRTQYTYVKRPMTYTFNESRKPPQPYRESI